VGELTWEEISIVDAGENAGWPIVEGPDCYDADTCDRSGLVGPVYYHEHGDLGRSITGGFVYRGSEIPSLQGKYVFGDWGGRWLWALEKQGEEWVASEPFFTNFFISSFGEDADGELYFTSYFQGGRIQKIMSYSALSDEDPSVPSETSLAVELAGPNPFSIRTSLAVTAAESGPASVDLFSATGRSVGRIFEAYLPAGTTERVVVEAEGLAPGVYFARLISGSSTATTSIVVAR